MRSPWPVVSFLTASYNVPYSDHYLDLFAAPLGLQVRGEQRRTAFFPRPHGLVTDREAPREDHLGRIAQTQLVAQPPHHDELRDVGRNRQLIEGCAGALIEASCGMRDNGPCGSPASWCGTALWWQERHRTGTAWSFSSQRHLLTWHSQDTPIPSRARPLQKPDGSVTTGSSGADASAEDDGEHASLKREHDP